MASYHLAVKSVRRSEGRSATAAAAYRHAERIECHREGRTHDYTRKHGVEASFIVAPEDAPAWTRDREALWNAAEARDTRVNSVTAREWELALPAELDAAGRRELAHGFARELVARYGVAADVAIHAPHREGDQRNHHAHVLTTTRRLTHEGLADKTRELDSKQTGGVEVERMRGRWAELQNHALERQGHAERVDHRTLHAQREAALSHGDELRAEELDRAAEVKLGPVVSAVERQEARAAERDGREYEPLTERGAQVHEARQARALLHELGQVRDRLRAELHERAELARETYAYAREEGADRVRAGLAALRAAVQKHGLAHGQEHGRGDEEDERERGPRHAAERPSLKDELARVMGRPAAHEEAEVARQAVRTPGHGLGDVREQLERLREREKSRTHEEIREGLNAALGRTKPVARQAPMHDEAHERDEDVHRHRERGHGWGL